MATVVELLGGECTGKTQLSLELAATIGAQVVPEALRSFVERHSRTPAADEQLDIMQTQAHALTEAVMTATPTDVIVCDPSPLMTAVYSLQYFDDASLLPAGLEMCQDSDLIVWCQPDIPWSADGPHRDGPGARERTHQLIRERVLPHLTEPTVIQAFGSPTERLDAVRRGLPG